MSGSRGIGRIGRALASAAFASLALTSGASAHPGPGHVITGIGTTNYGNRISINSSDLPGRYGSAHYNGLTIGLDHAEVMWWLIGPSNLPVPLDNHYYRATGTRDGHSYVFSIQADDGFPGPADVQVDGGPVERAVLTFYIAP